MKLLELRLLAFGPFTDAILDFDHGAKGLHIVYGPNEAGKSSALRAMRSFFYGIPERSGDDFVHAYGKMRVGATLRSDTGEVLELVRRKGRLNTLRAGDDQTVVVETVIADLLKGTNLDQFSTLFAIGYEDLVRGGQEIVRGGGQLGRTLFAAGSGIANLREVQQQLHAEAERLFKPTGQKPRINTTLSQYRHTQKALRQAALPGQQWQTHDRALIGAIKRKDHIESELGVLRREVHRLERIREALPLMAHRVELLNTIREHSNAVLLPEDFSERRQTLLTNLAIASSRIEAAGKALQEIREAISDLPRCDALLVNAERIEALHQEAGSNDKAARDRVQLDTRCRVLRGEARQLLRELRQEPSPEKAEGLRIGRSETVRIQALGARFERIMARMEQIREEIPGSERLVERLRQKATQIPPSQSVQPLLEAVQAAEPYVALEKQCQNEAVEIEQAATQLRIDLQKQSLWSGNLENLETLPLPSSETVDLFADRLQSTLRAQAECHTQFTRVSAELEATNRRLENLCLEGEIPTEADLQQARQLRDTGWRQIRIALGGESMDTEKAEAFRSAFPDSRHIWEAFEMSTRWADEVADRLRREADRVVAHARLLAEREALDRRVKHLRADMATVEKTLTDVQTEWENLWSTADITPRTPREMHQWLRNHISLVERAAGIRQSRNSNAALQQQINVCRQKLNQSLADFGTGAAASRETTPLADLIQDARKKIETQEALRLQSENLAAEQSRAAESLALARARVATCETELDQWQSQWERVMTPLGLERDALPSQANAVLEELKILFDKLAETRILQKRIEGIDRDQHTFTQKMTDLVEEVAPDLLGEPGQKVCAQLMQRLHQARTARAAYDDLEHRRLQERDKHEQALETRHGIQRQLESMCLEAGCAHPRELADAERRSAARQRMQSEYEALEERLRGLSAGATVENFLTEVSREDPDAIEATLAELAERITNFKREKSELDQTIGSERTELALMDGSARAAELAEQSQLLLGRLERDAESYARLKIAAVVLNLAMEQYRIKHQDPLLARADKLFAHLTGNSFEGLRIDINDAGESVLVGVRPGGKEIIGVEGMSEGTADQLYLALRLAGLEEYLDRNEPLPFIVDDILIKFDDQRAVAALKALQALSRQTQVIFFTHHHRIVELARQHLDPEVLHCHELTPHLATT